MITFTAGKQRKNLLKYQWLYKLQNDFNVPNFREKYPHLSTAEDRPNEQA